MEDMRNGRTALGTWLGFGRTEEGNGDAMSEMDEWGGMKAGKEYEHCRGEWGM